MKVVCHILTEIKTSETFIILKSFALLDFSDIQCDDAAVYRMGLQWIKRQSFFFYYLYRHVLVNSPTQRSIELPKTINYPLVNRKAGCNASSLMIIALCNPIII